MKKDLKKLTYLLTSLLLRNQPSPQPIGSNAAFTLAEVLITLGIIGIVAVLIISSTVEKYQQKVTVAQLKKAYNTISNALMKAEFEYGLTYNISVNSSWEELLKYCNKTSTTWANSTSCFELIFRDGWEINTKDGYPW